MQMYRQYARSKREKRVNIRISSKRYSQIGLVAAHCEGEFVFPCIYDETMRASVFENWFEDELLKEHVLIMDNATFLKKKVLQNFAGKQLQRFIFLPSYSPEYNPIERMRSIP